MQKHLNDYQNNGVDVFVQNDGIIKTSKIIYDGCLAKNGGDVYAHIGYVDQGVDDETFWHDMRDIKMKNVNGNIYEAIIPVDKTENALGLTFHDNNNNWDNNGSSDYVLYVK